jgi:hypothetical protein
VELLLMKAFSLGVLKGTIDQVEGQVRVKWVQPRVLDMTQISGIRDRLHSWSSQVRNAIIYRLKDSHAHADTSMTLIPPPLPPVAPHHHFCTLYACPTLFSQVANSAKFLESSAPELLLATQ